MTSNLWRSIQDFMPVADRPVLVSGRSVYGTFVAIALFRSQPPEWVFTDQRFNRTSIPNPHGITHWCAIPDQSAMSNRRGMVCSTHGAFQDSLTCPVCEAGSSERDGETLSERQIEIAVTALTEMANYGEWETYRDDAKRALQVIAALRAEVAGLRAACHALDDALAKRCLADANRDAEGTNHWPAGQEWDELVGTSQSIMRHRAWQESGLDVPAMIALLFDEYGLPKVSEPASRAARSVSGEDDKQSGTP